MIHVSLHDTVVQRFAAHDATPTGKPYGTLSLGTTSADSQDGITLFFDTVSEVESIIVALEGLAREMRVNEAADGPEKIRALFLSIAAQPPSADNAAILSALATEMRRDVPRDLPGITVTDPDAAPLIMGEC